MLCRETAVDADRDRPAAALERAAKAAPPKIALWVKKLLAGDAEERGHQNAAALGDSAITNASYQGR